MCPLAFKLSRLVIKVILVQFNCHVRSCPELRKLTHLPLLSTNAQRAQAMCTCVVLAAYFSPALPRFHLSVALLRDVPRCTDHQACSAMTTDIFGTMAQMHRCTVSSSLFGRSSARFAALYLVFIPEASSGQRAGHISNKFNSSQGAMNRTVGLPMLYSCDKDCSALPGIAVSLV